MFLYASDLHLSLNTWQKLPQVEDSIPSFIQLLSRCSFHGCPLVLGGDIFDSVKMTPQLLEKVLEARNMFSKVPIYYINGNHDLIDPSWCSFMSNSYHLGEQPYTLPDGEIVCGIDFKLSDEFPAAVGKVYPGCDFLIIHQTLDKLSNNIPGALDSSCLANFNCVLAGDYHVPGKSGNLYSAGSTNRRSISEPIGGAYWVSKKGVVSCPLDYRPFVIVSTTTVPGDALEKLTFVPSNDLKRTPWLCDYLSTGIVVVRGEITKEVKEQWSDVSGIYVMFVHDAKDVESVTVDTAGLVAARSSRYYLLSILDKYPCSEPAKVLIRDYLAHPDRCVENMKEHLNVVR